MKFQSPRYKRWIFALGNRGKNGGFFLKKSNVNNSPNIVQKNLNFTFNSSPSKGLSEKLYFKFQFKIFVEKLNIEFSKKNFKGVSLRFFADFQCILFWHEIHVFWVSWLCWLRIWKQNCFNLCSYWDLAKLDRNFFGAAILAKFVKNRPSNNSTAINFFDILFFSK